MDDPAEAQAYGRADFAAVNAAFVDRLLELAGPAEALTAVDLGTGPGDIPLRLARRRPGWTITAVDAAEAMIEIARAAAAREGGAERVQFVVADAKATGLAGGAFDVVFSNSILHHITDTAALWAEVRRLGRPGALVFFRDLARPASEPAARAIVDTYAGAESAVLQEEYYRSLLSAYEPPEVRRQLADAGLRGLHVAMVSDRHLDVWGRLG
jgi:ubiquinone/menaquinone biosynthesis C-methylase UbiE